MISRRRREGPDPYVDWKMRIFAVGAVLLVAGIFLDHRPLVGAAVVVLAAGLVFRVIEARRERRSVWGDEED
jgi:Flp pilus assembly protein TadB